MTMPDPVSPLAPLCTSIDTTLGRIVAATAAIEPLPGVVTAAGVVADAPIVTVSGAASLAWLCAMTPPMPPPSTPAIEVDSASTVHVGGALRQTSMPPLWPDSSAALRLAGNSQRDRHTRRPASAQLRTPSHYAVLGSSPRHGCPRT